MYNAAYMSGISLHKLSKSTSIFIFFTTVYALFVVLLPSGSVSQASLGLRDAKYDLLLIALRLPLIVLLGLMYFAYRRLNKYSVSIADTPEGEHFITITKGLGCIVWGMLATTLIGALLGAYANIHADFRNTSLIIINYMYLLLSLVAFSYISSGVHRITRKAHIIFQTNHLKILMLGLVFLGVVFCYLISTRLDGNAAGNSNAYFLPNWLVWGTVVIPYLYAWFLGVFAAMELLIIAKSTQGIIYRRALQYLAFGLVGVILAMVLLQYFRSVVPRTGKLALGSTLFFVYGIYLLGALGAISICKGAQRLQRIEDV